MKHILRWISLEEQIIFIPFVCWQSFDQDEEDQYGPTYNVGSFSKDFGYFDNDEVGTARPEQKPRILLMGLRRFNFPSFFSISSLLNLESFSSDVSVKGIKPRPWSEVKSIAR